MKVLFSTDGSRHAEYAERFLSKLLLDHGVDVDLLAVTVCPTSDLHSLGVDFPQAIHEIVDRCRDSSSEILERVSDRLKPRVKSIGTQILDGHPGKEILKQIDEFQPDVCVLGSHGWTFSERFFLGSVSSQIAKHASCSVLVVKPLTNEFENAEINRILIADDGSEGARKALDRFESFPAWDNESIRLVSVVQDAFSVESLIPEQTAEITEKKSTAAKKRLEARIKELKPHTREVDMQVRTARSIPYELGAAAEEFDADLVVLGGRKKPLLERALLGSVSLSVLHLAKCSVWIEK